MAGKHFDLDIRTNLGGDSASDITIPSQKAVKAYVDEAVSGKVDPSEVPSVSNKKITIKKNGTKVDDFTLNQTSDKEIDITVPTKTSDLTNDSGFLTEHQSLTAYAKTSELADVAISGNYNDLTNKPTIPTVPTNVSAFNNDAGYLTEDDITSVMVYKGTVATVSALPSSGNKVGDCYNVTENGGNYAWDGSSWDYLGQTLDLSGYQLKSTAVTHSENTAVGSTIKPVYIDSNGVAKEINYSIAKSVPSDAKFSDTTYSAGTGLSLSGTTINHSNSITAGNTGNGTATSGSTLSIPYVTYDAQGHITGKGNRTHTVTGFLTEHQDISGKANLSELADVATSGDYNDLSNKPTIPTVPTNVSAFTNDAGYLTAHQSLSEYYTKTELDGKLTGAMRFKGTVNTVSALPTSGNEVGDMYNVKSTGANYAWDGEDWDKLSENIDLSGVVPNTRKVNNKALSADITLSASDVGALPDTTVIPVVPTNVSAFTNDAGYLTSHQDISGKADLSELADVATTGSYNDLTNKPSIPTKTSDLTNDSGFLTSHQDISGKADLSALADVALSGDYDDLINKPTNVSAFTNDAGYLTEHQSLSGYVPTSRTVNGKALSSNITLSASDVNALPSTTSIPSKTSELTNDSGFLTSHQDISGKADLSELATVATTGDYDDLTNKPTIPIVPTDVSAFNNDAGYLTEHQSLTGYAKTSELSTVATSGSYEDLTNKPTIPTNTNQLTNGAGFITASAIPSAVSAFTNDAGYLTEHQDITGKANASEVYTKTEIDGKLTGAMRFKGTKASASALPSTGNTTGDMWNVTDTGANYAWDGSAWDKLSENIDLSGVVPNTRTVNGKALSSDITLTYSDVGALSSSTSIPSKTSDLTNDSGYTSVIFREWSD